MAVKSLFIKTVATLRNLLVFFSLLFCVVPACFIFSCSEQDQQSYSIDSLKQLQHVDTLRQKLFFLQMEEKFWKNRIKLADNKTIHLIVDLVENCVLIEVKGVPLRVSEYDILKRDFQTAGQSLVKWCSNPFTLIREESSTPKEPIRIRRLPEETSKIEEGYNLEFLEETEPAFVRLYFDRSLVIEFIEHNISIPDSLIKNLPDTNWIQFTMARQDIIATFRALPDRAARCNGVAPLFVVIASGSAPASSKSSTTSAFPSRVATCRGVYRPIRVPASSLAPA